MIVLDTNVVSEVMRPDPIPVLLRWLNVQSGASLHLASVTLAELLFSIAALPSGGRKDRLAEALDGLLALFTRRVLPFDQEAVRRFASMAADACGWAAAFHG